MEGSEEHTEKQMFIYRSHFQKTFPIEIGWNCFRKIKKKSRGVWRNDGSV